METTPGHECGEFCEQCAPPAVITCSGGAVLPRITAQVPQEASDGA